VKYGASAIVAGLAARDVRVVFGLPGTQSIALHEALRRGGLRSVSNTSEFAATFMAVGHFRASGRPAAVSTIPGPGFTLALTGIAEARHDSAALVHIFGRSPGSVPAYGFQAIDQHAIGAPLFKEVVEVDSASGAMVATARAVDAALAGEPGPVGLEWNPAALTEPGDRTDTEVPPAGSIPVDEAGVVEAVRRLRSSTRPVLLVGGGACSAAGVVRTLAERLRAPVITTVSGRGVIPEDHELAMGWDPTRAPVDVASQMLRGAD
jgi:thiamine pyrophosphate-dependent acetolactate synthase large subunit-like protein